MIGMFSRAGAAAMMSRRRASAAPPPAFPDAIGNGAALWLGSAGITQSLGTVASVDSAGSNTVRYQAPTEPERPLAIAGASLDLMRFDGVNDRLVALSTLALVRPYTIGIVLAHTFTATNRTILDFDSGGRMTLAGYNTVGNHFRWADNLTGITTTTPLVSGTYYSLILRSNTLQAGAAGASQLLLDGVQEGTGAPLANAAAASAWSIGRLIAGGNPAAFDLVDVCLFNGEYLDDAEVAELDAYHSYVKARI